MTFLDVFNRWTLSSVLNVAPATRPVNFLTWFHPTRVMFEANVAQRRVQQSHLPRILRNARRLRHRRLQDQRLTRRLQDQLHNQLHRQHSQLLLLRCSPLLERYRQVAALRTQTVLSTKPSNGWLKTRSTMEAIGVATNCCNVTCFESCITRPMETIGLITMLTQLGFNPRVFAIGDQSMHYAEATASKWISFLFTMTICKEQFPTNLANWLPWRIWDRIATGWLEPYHHKLDNWLPWRIWRLLTTNSTEPFHQTLDNSLHWQAWFWLSTSWLEPYHHNLANSLHWQRCICGRTNSLEPFHHNLANWLLWQCWICVPTDWLEPFHSSWRNWAIWITCIFTITISPAKSLLDFVPRPFRIGEILEIMHWSPIVSPRSNATAAMFVFD